MIDQTMKNYQTTGLKTIKNRTLLKKNIFTDPPGNNYRL
jgi:hypothetical protein